MSRRTSARMAEDAAKAASDAARTLQARGQEARAERAQVEPVEPANEPEARKPAQTEREDSLSDERINELKSQHPHDLAMDEIVKRQSERQGLPEVPAEEPAPAPETPAPVAEAPPAEATPAAPEVPAAPEMVRVKIDGEESEVSKAEVDEAGGVQAYQIQKASEKRLREATEAKAEAKKLLEMAQRMQPPAAPPAPPVSDTDFIKERMDTVMFGPTPEARAAALQEIISRNRVDPGAVVVQAMTSMKYESAFERFRTEFADLYTNPMLADLVTIQIHKGMAQAVPNGKPDWQKLAQIDFPKLFTTIGNQVRSVAGRPSQPATAATAPAATGATAPGTTSQVSEKEARKASIVNPPSSAARAAVPAEPKPESRADVLNEMRKSRGHPTE